MCAWITVWKAIRVSCGSDRLLMQILRQDGYDGIVLSDCGAIDDFLSGKRTQNISGC